jgi:F0F1-type ATP synthase membrane subunit b/b'
MSVVEEVRGVMQDFLAPELRALKERVGALERKVDDNERRAEERFQETQRHVDQRFQEAQCQVDQRFEDAERRAETRHGELVNWLNLAAPVSKLEQKESTQ